MGYWYGMRSDEMNGMGWRLLATATVDLRRGIVGVTACPQSCRIKLERKLSSPVI